MVFKMNREPTIAVAVFFPPAWPLRASRVGYYPASGRSSRRGCRRDDYITATARPILAASPLARSVMPTVFGDAPPRTSHASLRRLSRAVLKDPAPLPRATVVGDVCASSSRRANAPVGHGGCFHARPLCA